MCAVPGFEVYGGKDLSPSPENLVHNAGLLFQLFAVPGFKRKQNGHPPVRVNNRSLPFARGRSGDKTRGKISLWDARKKLENTRSLVLAFSTKTLHVGSRSAAGYKIMRF